MSDAPNAGAGQLVTAATEVATTSVATSSDSDKAIAIDSISSISATAERSEPSEQPTKRFRDVIDQISRRKSGEMKLNASEDFLSFSPAEATEPKEQALKRKKTSKKVASLSANPDLEEIDQSAPWARGRRYVSKGMDRTACLHEEILDFVDFISPTAAENKRRSFLVQHFQNITKELWPQASLHVFGSYATGMHLPSSDIDMVVMGCEDSKGLNALASVIRADGGFDRIQVIAKARVPIIKFEDVESGIPLNICFGQAGGLENTNIVKEFLIKMPALKPLVLVLKQFLYNRDLHETYTGGMGSYLLTMTVVSHLQQHPGRGPSYSEPDTNLGALLVDYLHLYGIRFNFGRIGISVKDGGSFFDKQQRGWTTAGREQLLSVEDPNDENNDLGKNSYNIRSAQRAFEHAFYSLAVPDPTSRETMLGSILKWDQRWHSALAMHRLARFKKQRLDEGAEKSKGSKRANKGRDTSRANKGKDTSRSKLKGSRYPAKRQHKVVARGRK